MSDAEHRIKRFELARLIGGDDGAAVAVDRRLRKYEVDKVVKPEIRREPFVMPPLHVAHTISPSVPTASPHDTWFEARRHEGLQSLDPAPAPKLFNEHYYSREDAKVVAQHERKIAPLSVRFCQFAFGAVADPDPLTVPALSNPIQTGNTQRALPNAERADGGELDVGCGTTRAASPTNKPRSSRYTVMDGDTQVKAKEITDLLVAEGFSLENVKAKLGHRKESDWLIHCSPRNGYYWRQTTLKAFRDYSGLPRDRSRNKPKPGLKSVPT